MTKFLDDVVVMPCVSQRVAPKSAVRGSAMPISALGSGMATPWGDGRSTTHAFEPLTAKATPLGFLQVSSG